MYEQAVHDIQIILKEDSTQRVQKVVDYLHDFFNHYSWVGIYKAQGKNLILTHWKGPQATEHTSIPLGHGICGSAAQSGKTEIIPDVTQDSRYLSCFISTKSEIVVPIKKNSSIVGEIDIDSNVSDVFTQKDKEFLERIADMLSEHI